MTLKVEILPYTMYFALCVHSSNRLYLSELPHLLYTMKPGSLAI